MTDSNPPDDPFAEFEDWLKDGPAGAWPLRTPNGGRLSYEQEKIVAANASLLCDRSEWFNKVNRFNQLIPSSGSVEDGAALRKRYEIRFDQFSFSPQVLDCKDFEFPCATCFAGAYFKDGTDFRGASFDGGNVTFNGATFGGPVLFSHASFKNCAVSFVNAKVLRGDVRFRLAKFINSGLTLKGAVIEQGGLWLHFSQIPNGDLSLYEITIRGRLDCSAVLAKKADFRYSEITGVSDWSRADFQSIPDFRQMKLTRSPDVAEMQILPPVLQSKYETIFRWPFLLDAKARLFKRATDPDDVLKLRKLKAMAIAANDHEKDGEFFAYEMMAKRGTEHTTFWQLLFNTIYWKVSFYGQSYLRPLAWLGGSIGAFAYLYALLAFFSTKAENAVAFSFGAVFSIKNALPFLGAIVGAVPTPNDHVSWFQTRLDLLDQGDVPYEWFTTLGAIQSLIGAFFFFFLLLGLRNKFRLK